MTTRIQQLTHELDALNAKLKTLTYGSMELRTAYRQRNSVLVKLRKAKQEQ